jgi:hypothetical protein
VSQEDHAEQISSLRQAERLSHGLYGLIIITATLGAERAHVTKASDAFTLLISTAFVLFLAHTYSAWMAERSVEGSKLGAVARRTIVLDNLPVVGAIAVPLLLVSLAGIGVMDLQVAYRGAIAFSLATLFAVGFYQSRTASMSWFHSTLSGAAAGSIGVIVIWIEAFFG